MSFSTAIIVVVNKKTGLCSVCTTYAVEKLAINSVCYKFLISGHSQNEGDNAHSLIEKSIKRAKKSGPIYVPDQYVNLIRDAKTKRQPLHCPRDAL
ncbi:unnamed protein product [Euphydryas editha]|uniref:Uncharacterized protein n=1 Tax=Euphydryas editha TaxID=104508 RepID=A0AAU9VB06_EUPED|nr:unnamed protein product [Euphydryas editha]